MKYNRTVKRKYHNRKTTVNGIKFDSKKEAERFRELSVMQQADLISDLRRQVKYVLVPAQRGPEKIGPRGGVTPGKIIEREVSYYADFVYKDLITGETIVEDVKGMRTPEYIIKRKLMLAVHGIMVREF